MAIINYDKLSPVAKRRVREAGYTPDEGGKTASRKSSKQIKEERLQTMQEATKRPVETQPTTMTPVASTPTKQVEQNFRRGASIREANAQLQELKGYDGQTTEYEQSQQTRYQKTVRTYEETEKKASGKVKPIINRLFDLDSDNLTPYAKTNPVYMQASTAVKESIRELRDKPVKGAALFATGYITGPAGRAISRVPGGKAFVKGGLTLATGAYGAVVGYQYGTARGSEAKGKVLGRAAYEVATMSGGMKLGGSPISTRNVVTDQMKGFDKTGREFEFKRTETPRATVEETRLKDASGRVSKTRTEILKEQPKSLYERASEKGSKVRDMFREAKASAKEKYDAYRQRNAEAAKAREARDLMERGKNEIQPYKPEKSLVPKSDMLPAKRGGGKKNLPDIPKYPIEPRPGTVPDTVKPPKYPIEPRPDRPPAPRPKTPPERYKRPRPEVFEEGAKGGGAFGIPPLPFFGGGGGVTSDWPGYGSSKGRGLKGYAPSQAALAFNIKGKRPGRTTGLELRPITK